MTLICGSEYANSEQSIHVLKESHVLMFTPEISRKIPTKCLVTRNVFHGISPKYLFKKTPTYILEIQSINNIHCKVFEELEMKGNRRTFVYIEICTFNSVMVDVSHLP